MLERSLPASELALGHYLLDSRVAREHYSPDSVQALEPEPKLVHSLPD